ncbi:hypothetical protein M5F00_11035 [Acinetobacter sp. ANC 4945]|nr:hypothetical protein [Acinetobacter amyesii]MCL6248395.1 hypothetical protein [Acinetobacter amyesii]
MANPALFSIFKSSKKVTFCDKKKTKKLSRFLHISSPWYMAKKIQDGTMYITSSIVTNFELAPLGLNLDAVEKMEDKALRNKQILVRLTIDEYQKMVASSNALQMNKSDYMRMKILTESHAQIIDPRDIHAIRIAGLVLVKLLEELKDTQLIPHELEDIKQLIDELKIIVRRLNDSVSKV